MDIRKSRMAMKKRYIISKPCGKCGHNRWKTVKKENGIRTKVACRKCGESRDIK